MKCCFLSTSKQTYIEITGKEIDIAVLFNRKNNHIGDRKALSSTYFEQIFHSFMLNTPN